MSVFKRIRAGTTDEFYSIKVEFQGKQILRATGARTEADARQLERALRAELRTDHAAEAIEATKRRHTGTIAAIVAAYIAADCPDRREIPRIGKSLETEKYHLSNILKWDGWPAPAIAISNHYNSYFKYRSEQIMSAKVRRGKDGRRSVTLELTALSGAFSWAVWNGLMDRNPLIGRRSFEDSTAVKHCRVRKPCSGDVLHMLAGYLLGRTHAAYGWLVLIEAFTGLRSAEAALLLAEPIGGEAPEAGYMDDRFLYVQRVKLGRKAALNPVVRLDDPARPYIRQVIEAARLWNLQRYPRDQYTGKLRLCPNQAGQPLGRTLLWGAMRDACLALGLPRSTPHSLRAYYCTARRGQGIDDNQIAYELNQRGGPELVRETYGDPPANWSGLANVFTWLPNTPTVPVAWSPFTAMPEAERKVIAMP